MKKRKNKLSPALRGALITLSAVIIIAAAIVVWKVYFQAESEDLEPSYTFTSVKVALLNGCGRDNVATEVKDYLVEKEIQNLDIISWKNVARQMFIYDKSLIVVKKHNEEKLNFLMNLTGIQRRIYAENDQFIEEFQIILGKDYKEYFK